MNFTDYDKGYIHAQSSFMVSLQNYLTEVCNDYNRTIYYGVCDPSDKSEKITTIIKISSFIEKGGFLRLQTSYDGKYIISVYWYDTRTRQIVGLADKLEINDEKYRV